MSRSRGKAAPRRDGSLWPLSACWMLLVGMGGCAGSGRWPFTEPAPGSSLPPCETRRCLVGDAAALTPICRPVGRRMGLIEVHDPQEWELLSRATHEIGPRPDLDHGIVVGVTCLGGTPLDGDWPFRWESVRVVERNVVLDIRFRGGNYLPDGVMHLETIYVPNARQVAAVILDGVWYSP